MDSDYQRIRLTQEDDNRHCPESTRVCVCASCERRSLRYVMIGKSKDVAAGGQPLSIAGCSEVELQY